MQLKVILGDTKFNKTIDNHVKFELQTTSWLSLWIMVKVRVMVKVSINVRVGLARICGDLN